MSTDNTKGFKPCQPVSFNTASIFARPETRRRRRCLLCSPLPVSPRLLHIALNIGCVRLANCDPKRELSLCFTKAV